MKSSGSHTFHLGESLPACQTMYEKVCTSAKESACHQSRQNGPQEWLNWLRAEIRLICHADSLEHQPVFSNSIFLNGPLHVCKNATTALKKVCVLDESIR